MVFFSGTGNSAAIANQISNRIEGEQVMPRTSKQRQIPGFCIFCIRYPPLPYIFI